MNQMGAIAAFDCYDELDAHVPRYQENRDLLYRGLPKTFLGDHAPSDGAFYLYADVSALTDDSVAFAGRYSQKPVLRSRQVLILTPVMVKRMFGFLMLVNTGNEKGGYSALMPGLQKPSLLWPFQKRHI